MSACSKHNGKGKVDSNLANVDQLLDYCKGYNPPKSYVIDGENVKGRVNYSTDLKTLFNMAKLLKDLQNLS